MGDTYSKLHVWVAKKKLKPNLCEKCKEKRKLELSSTNHSYTGDIKDWEWLCRSCHKKKDYLIKTKKFKLDPSKRKNINLATFKRVEDFLKKQKEPMFISDISRVIKVDYDSLKYALDILKIKKDKYGRIKL